MMKSYKTFHVMNDVQLFPCHNLTTRAEMLLGRKTYDTYE